MRLASMAFVMGQLSGLGEWEAQLLSSQWSREQRARWEAYSATAFRGLAIGSDYHLCIMLALPKGLQPFLRALPAGDPEFKHRNL